MKSRLRNLRSRAFGATALTFALLGAACSEAPDPDGIAGMYKLDRHAINQNGCDAGPATTEVTYVRLSRGSKKGEACYSTSECTSADPASCGEPVRCSLRKSGDAWVSAMTAVSGTTPPCLLQYFEEKLVLLPERRIRLEYRSHHFRAEAQDAACTAQEALQKGSSMPCVQYKSDEGSRLD